MLNFLGRGTLKSKVGDEIEIVIKTCGSPLTFRLRVARSSSLIFHLNEKEMAPDLGPIFNEEPNLTKQTRFMAHFHPAPYSP